MLADLYAQYAGIPAEEAERLLAMPAQAIYQDEYYQNLVASLDGQALHDTATHARTAYDSGLPMLKAKYRLMDTVMSGYTLCNWVLGYLNFPSKLSDLLEQHGRIPVTVMVDMLPELVALLDKLPAGRDVWQRAFLIITLPLLARNN
jgi:hypothetical protein